MDERELSRARRALLVVESWGCKPVLVDGKITLSGRLTRDARDLLYPHRDAVAYLLRLRQRREWLWPGGHRYTEEPEDAWLFGHLERSPAGSRWWRWVGETAWRPVVEEASHVVRPRTFPLPPGEALAEPAPDVESLLPEPQRQQPEPRDLDR